MIAHWALFPLSVLVLQSHWVVVRAAGTAVLYCDGVVQMPSREDEGEEACRRSESLDTLTLKPCRGGVLCDGECVPFSDWCINGTKTRRVCGSLLNSYNICRNTTFWNSLPCNVGVRCSDSWWPGQCVSHQNSQSCVGNSNGDDSGLCFSVGSGSALSNITRNSYLCNDKFGTNIRVCATKCDRMLDGCVDGEDEKNCAPGGHTRILLIVVFASIIMTILVAEGILKILYSSKNSGPNLDYEMQTQNVLDDLLDRNITELARDLYDPANWKLGEWDETSVLRPQWTAGSFSAEKLPRVRQLYADIRRTSNKRSAFSLLVRYTLEKCHFKLRHFVLLLVYNDLESLFLRENPTHTQNVDISIKSMLPEKDSTAFYGSIFPYFDLVRFVLKRLPHSIVSFFHTQYTACSRRVPELGKYIVAVIIGILGFYIDFVKDILIATDVSFLLPAEGEKWDFKGRLVIMLWITAFLSQAIIGLKILANGPTRLFGHKYGKNTTSRRDTLINIGIKLLFLLTCPLAPALLLYLNARMARKIRANEKQFHDTCTTQEISIETSRQLNNCHREREVMLRQKLVLEKTLVNSYQLDLTLETTPQILIQVLIVLLVSATFKFSWVRGTEGVFDGHDDASETSTTLFYLSIAWSLYSIHSALFSSFLFRKQYSVPDLGKVLMFLLLLLDTFPKLLAYVLAFSPFLGLFDLQLPHHLDTRLTYSADLESRYSHILTLSRSPDWYTGITFREFLYTAFFWLPAVHIISVLVYKTIYIRDFLLGKKTRRRFFRQLVDCVVHSCSTLLVPNIWRDWDRDETARTRAGFVRVWHVVQAEYRMMVVLHCLENMLLCVPLVLTCARGIYRSYHLPLLPEEEAVLSVSYLLVCSPLFYLVTASIQILLFNIYNTKGHPWSRLLVQEDC